MALHKSQFYFEMKVPESYKFLAGKEDKDISFQLLEGGVVQIRVVREHVDVFVKDRGVRLPFTLTSETGPFRFKPTGKEIIVESIDVTSVFGEWVPQFSLSFNIEAYYKRYLPELADTLLD